MTRSFSMMGPQHTGNGVGYSVWAPKNRTVSVAIVDEAGVILRELPLEPTSHGFYFGHDREGQSGDLYYYRLENGKLRPDPVSRWQPLGVHGPSMVIDGHHFPWPSERWQAQPFRDWIVYELHIGTFTLEGTFRAATERLEHVAELGINAVEIMPIAEFPGTRNWGYDGVYLFAPSRNYGHPDHFRQLVHRAHELGLAVILDVVYNHFGPDGNYLADYAGEYLDESKKTPWGGAIRYGDPSFAPLRDLVISNAIYWLREFRVDALRCDATHAILDDSTPHILADLTEAIHSVGGLAIAEDNRPQPRLLHPVHSGGFGFDGVWADDLHHVLHVRETREQHGYFAEYQGSSAELAGALRDGWLSVNADLHHLSPECFVQGLANHDQIGNRPFGDRPQMRVSPSTYRALAALYCLTPGTPLFFMGQEWGASTPFLYFTDHEPALGKLVTEGRRREFADFFEAAKDRASIPDPQAEETFLQSKLIWAEKDEPGHLEIQELLREWLALRKKLCSLRPSSRRDWKIEVLSDDLIVFRTGELLIIHTAAAATITFDELAITRPPAGRKWQMLIESNEPRFGGEGQNAVLQDDIWRTPAPVTQVLIAASAL